MTEVLVSSTVLILALAALRWLLRGKIDPRLQYALWLLAALRLLLPVPLVSSPVSVMNAAADVPAAVQRLTAPEDRRAPQPAAEAAPAQPAAAEVQTQTQPKDRLPVRTMLKTAWLAGAAILAGMMLAQNLAFLRKLRRVRQPLACAESPIPVWLVPEQPRQAWRRSALSCGTSWRIFTQRISSGASCGSSASVCTGSTPSCGWPRRFPGATVSWPATSG